MSINTNVAYHEFPFGRKSAIDRSHETEKVLPHVIRNPPHQTHEDCGRDVCDLLSRPGKGRGIA